jgi:hypothetical protein
MRSADLLLLPTWSPSHARRTHGLLSLGHEGVVRVLLAHTPAPKHIPDFVEKLAPIQAAQRAGHGAVVRLLAAALAGGFAAGELAPARRLAVAGRQRQQQYQQQQQQQQRLQQGYTKTQQKFPHAKHRVNVKT